MSLCDNRCSECYFFRLDISKAKEKIQKELYDIDQRTPTSSYLKYWFNMNRYKMEPHQVSIDDIINDMFIITHRLRGVCSGVCFRYPKSVGVHKDNSCGEFVLKTLKTKK
jgi:hypothetical protein